VKRAAVTGGAGFIGSHLVDRLIAEGYAVKVVDNLSTGRARNLEHLRDESRLDLFKTDICDEADLTPAFKNVDVVFHLAGLADIVPSIERPADYFRTNVDGTFSVMQAARAAGIPRVVYAASSSCYGLAKRFPTPESAEIAPEYPYALTKYLGERIVLHWGRVYEIAATSLRLFNVFGPRARTTGTYGAVFGVFLAQKLAGKPFTVVGDGSQTRDFTYVTDVAEAFVRAAEAPLGGEILNVGSGGTYSVNHLVRLLGGDAVHIPKRPGEPQQTFADIGRIREKLGWRAVVPFEEGVRRMLERIEDWRDAPLWEPATIEAATRSWFDCLRKTADLEAV
jgi:UDP-glucose 4-epimerase